MTRNNPQLVEFLRHMMWDYMEELEEMAAQGDMEMSCNYTVEELAEIRSGLCDLIKDLNKEEPNG